MNFVTNSLVSSSVMLDPAHDPERRSPRATRGSDENFLPKSAVTGSSSNESATNSQDNLNGPTGNTKDRRGEGDYLYPWHYDHSNPGPPYYTGNKLETVMDRMEQAMHNHPLPYKPKAVNTSEHVIRDIHGNIYDPKKTEDNSDNH